MSAYELVEIELGQPLPRIQLAAAQSGVGLMLRARSRPVGFLLKELPPGTPLPPETVEAWIRETMSPEQIAAALCQPPPGETVRDPLPSLTVAICTKDHPEQLARCLASFANLHDREGGFTQALEILVVDNASQSSRTRQVTQEFANARYVQEPKPGLNFARNTALKAASGEIIAFIDDDVVVDPFWLAGLAEAWSRDPHAGAYTGQVFPLVLDTPAQILTEQLGGFRKGFQPRRFTAACDDDPLYPCTTIFGNGCNMAFRRNLALGLGGFDEALDTGRALPGGGDLDMLYRVVRSGHALVYEPSFLVFHEHRRTHQQLRSQICRSWGLGCMAFLVKISKDPEQGWKARQFIRWWFHDLATRFKQCLRRGNTSPADLIVAEFWGALLGFCGGYHRSQRRVARLRRKYS